MTRWNISKIFFLGVAGQRRDVQLNPGSMNIITGASGTGKSTLIKAIDYCLGSSKCELPAHVRRRCLAVGIKWTFGETEMIIGRIIPPVGQIASNKMFYESGHDLKLPATIDEIEGISNARSVRSRVEQAFGIGDLRRENDSLGRHPGRVSIRQVTPYMFVTKEVIYSESVLLHGLEKPNHAKDIIATMPYFLRATDEASAMKERRLRRLHRELATEEARASAEAAANSALKNRALSLLTEAHRIGLTSTPQTGRTEGELLTQLKALPSAAQEVEAYPDESEFSTLQADRRTVLNALAAAKRKFQATRTAIREASGFEGAVNLQREKLMLAEHLQLDAVVTNCPVCDAPSERGQKIARALQATLSKVRAESVAVERIRPKLVERGGELQQEIERLNFELRLADDHIQTWLRQSEETKRLATLAQARAHILGRVSFFLEASTEESRQPTRDFSVLRDEIDELETQVDREAKRIKLRRAETKISQFATEAFSALPTVAPCIDAELDFSTRPEIRVIEAETGAILRLPDVGSDQNYLAVHIALSFALQRFFEQTNSPVPGLLIFDQISRPYYPTSGESDETEISGGQEDEDTQAMRKHIDFLFAETKRREGLQVLLIEHAYFADDPRYVKATHERWTRASGEALIPTEWPTRGDAVVEKV